MVYDLLDAKRQWRTYLENLKLIHVPNQSDLAAAALAAQGKSNELSQSAQQLRACDQI